MQQSQYFAKSHIFLRRQLQCECVATKFIFQTTNTPDWVSEIKTKTETRHKHKCVDAPFSPRLNWVFFWANCTFIVQFHTWKSLYPDTRPRLLRDCCCCVLCVVFFLFCFRVLFVFLFFFVIHMPFCAIFHFSHDSYYSLSHTSPNRFPPQHIEHEQHM